MKKYCYLIAVLTLSFHLYYTTILQSFVNNLTWANDSLYLNVIANRGAWRACKKFGWCDNYHTPPQWDVVWKGEVRWLA